MHVLGINGSPRKGGNTSILLQKLLDTAGAQGCSTEFFQLGGQVVRGCIACGACSKRKNKQCALKDDCFNELFGKMLLADAIVIGSPTYFADVSAETKALLDRAGHVALANGRLFRGKIGAAVIAVRRGGAIHTFDTINHMYLMSQMIVPGSVYWNMGIGLEKGDVNEDAEGLNNMVNLGATIAWLGKALAPNMHDFPEDKSFFG